MPEILVKHIDKQIGIEKNNQKKKKIKTFDEFVNEGMAAHYAAHYAKKALRSLVPRI